MGPGLQWLTATMSRLHQFNEIEGDLHDADAATLKAL